ncbi:hypothetical protein K438DRAFT_1751334 [Mycena galopus ATCC 62051]|nr:hypothetical protein K438DRAFT_1751334 [Mycena galopus ATCC 62051]
MDMHVENYYTEQYPAPAVLGDGLVFGPASESLTMATTRTVLLDMRYCDNGEHSTGRTMACTPPSPNALQPPAARTSAGALMVPEGDKVAFNRIQSSSKYRLPTYIILSTPQLAELNLGDNLSTISRSLSPTRQFSFHQSDQIYVSRARARFSVWCLIRSGVPSEQLVEFCTRGGISRIECKVNSSICSAHLFKPVINERNGFNCYSNCPCSVILLQRAVHVRQQRTASSCDHQEKHQLHCRITREHDDVSRCSSLLWKELRSRPQLLRPTCETRSCRQKDGEHRPDRDRCRGQVLRSVAGEEHREAVVSQKETKRDMLAHDFPHPIDPSQITAAPKNCEKEPEEQAQKTRDTRNSLGRHPEDLENGIRGNLGTSGGGGGGKRGEAVEQLGLRAVAVSDGDGSRRTGTGPVRQAKKYCFVTDGYGTGRPVNGNTRPRLSTGDGCQQTCIFVKFLSRQDVAELPKTAISRSHDSENAESPPKYRFVPSEQNGRNLEVFWRL